MNDESLRRRMQSTLETSQDPDPEFIASLHDDLALKLGLSSASAGTATLDVQRAPRRRPTWLLLAATIALLIALLASLAAAGAFDDLLQRAVPVLRQIQADGRITVAVRPDLPQAQSPAGTIDGFDVGVAEEIAQRLGVTVARNVTTAEEMLSGSPTWQLGMPGVQIDSTTKGAFLPTIAYYHWPHFLVVSAAEAATSLSDLAGQTVCVVGGSASEAWALEQGSFTASVRDEESQCREDLVAGVARAYVSELMLPGDFATKPDVRVLGEGRCSFRAPSRALASLLPSSIS
jgi:ABC-type amino acid transport substrate-binding protein